ncbi:co-chaperone GroES [bacterium]|nr:co-chaperone GroES [Candidatus Elulimicrobium humile]
MNIQPLFDKVLIKPQKTEEKTASGIYIPDTAKQDKPQFGEVISVGKDVKIVEVDQKVVFAKYGPTEISIEGEDYLIVKEEDILATL